MNIFVTRKIPEKGIEMLREAGYEVQVSAKDGVLTKEELIAALKEKEYDAVLCLLTDTVDGDVFDAAPKAKIFANFAVGFNNINIEEAKKRGILISNTPDVLTNTVAEFTCALICAITKRVVEGDTIMRGGRYDGWAPEFLLGTDLSGKTLGLLGAGRIGTRVAEIMTRGFGMKTVYYDVKENPALVATTGAEFRGTPEEVLKEADVVSIHVPLLPATTHFINKDRLALMKKSAYLVNTSRGPVIDEVALGEALRAGTIRGAAIDVFEREPEMAAGLAELPNIIVTPHIASATEETRSAMAELAAVNIIAALSGLEPPNIVKSI